MSILSFLAVNSVPAPMITLRIRGPSGTSSLQVQPLDTIANLKVMIEGCTGIAPTRQDLRLGFPPKPLPAFTDSQETIASLGFKNGDPVVVAEQESPASLPPPPQARQAQTSGPIAAASTPPPSVASKTDRIEYVEVDGGYLVLRVVPDDNSCLFTAAGLVLDQSRKDVVPYLRRLVADAIKSDVDTWSDVVLGRPRDDYISTILGKNSWGGAIELSIFSKHYRHEICSVDVQTGRIDRFGQGEGYESQVLLVYSGIHYDALTFSYSQPTPSSAFPPPNIEFDTTVFPTSSDEIVAAALKLVSKLRATHAYTDAATFTLRCEVCGTALVGEKEARMHAMETSHTRFGEYDG